MIRKGVDYYRKTCLLFFLLLLPASISLASAADTLTIASPDGASVRLHFWSDIDGPTYNVEYKGKKVIDASPLRLQLDDGTDVGEPTTKWVFTSQGSYSGSIESRLSERAVQPDNYNYALIGMRQSADTFSITIRVYDEGFAFRMYVGREKNVGLKADLSEINLSNLDDEYTYYTESGSESGYEKKDDKINSSSWTPLFATSSSLSVLINEAANNGIASKAKLNMTGHKIQFNQLISQKNNNFITPWRYVVFGSTPKEMLNGKYMLHSLNEPADKETDYDWIRPGKVFRNMVSTDEVFHTDSVIGAIDFAVKKDFQYVLLDAGWYGLGKSNESNPMSDPFIPVPTLDMARVMEHADSAGIGIILYVNKAAWQRYDNKAIIDLYAQWGVSGIKLGYVDAITQEGLRQIYDIVDYAASKHIVLNVHDSMRPTGVERTKPNLMTTEGIRGGEYREANSTAHTTLLPFSRFMSGAADYTICFPEYPLVENSMLAKLPQTKAHQLALSVIYFSPLQHVLWYRHPWHYSVRPHEIDFFTDLETVWDDYVVLDAVPEKSFSIARKRDDRWILASITNEQSRTVDLPLSFLESGMIYEMRLFEDDGFGSIHQSNISNLTYCSVMSLDLNANGGAVAIIDPTIGTINSIDIRIDASSDIDIMPDYIGIHTEGLQHASLVNMHGMVVGQSKVSNSGEQELRIGTTGLAPGIYVVVVRSRDGSHSRRVRIR